MTKNEEPNDLEKNKTEPKVDSKSKFFLRIPEDNNGKFNIIADREVIIFTQFVRDIRTLTKLIPRIKKKKRKSGNL